MELKVSHAENHYKFFAGLLSEPSTKPTLFLALRVLRIARLQEG